MQNCRLLVGDPVDAANVWVPEIAAVRVDLTAPMDAIPAAMDH